MRERSILFNGVMVRAILAGQKTQTRRVVKWNKVAPGLNLRFTGLSAHRYPKGWVLESDSRVSSEWRCQPTLCPYGQPGDRLWVRETWMPGYYHEAGHEDGPKVSVIHRADNAEATVAAPSYELAEQWEREFSEDGDEAPPWRPSIHMPRWACRLVLEITAVRAERLQAISKKDALAEGIDHEAMDGYALAGMPRPAGYAFRDLWTSTGGDWASNPWVWVIEFREVTP